MFSRGKRQRGAIQGKKSICAEGENSIKVCHIMQQSAHWSHEILHSWSQYLYLTFKRKVQKEELLLWSPEQRKSMISSMERRFQNHFKAMITSWSEGSSAIGGSIDKEITLMCRCCDSSHGFMKCLSKHRC